MKKFTHIESHITVNQYFIGKIVGARYEVTERSDKNYQVDLYINGDYLYQWNNENTDMFEGEKMSKKVAINFMLYLSNSLFVACEFKFVTIHSINQNNG